MNEFYTHLTKVDMDATGLKKGIKDIEAMEAKLKKLGITTAKVTGVGDPMIKSISKQGRVMTTTTQKFATMDKQNHTLVQSTGAITHKMGDFQKALARVAIVVPVWMLARTVIQGVIQTISQGIKQLVELDRQLQKSKQVIHDFAGSSDTAIKILEERFRSFSMEAGISIEKLTASFYRFGTVGIGFQDAMAGAIASAKLARVTFGNVDTIARSLAMAYRLLGHTMDETLAPAEKMEQMAGMIYTLWQKNAFEADEFAQSLENFIGMANVANFEMSEMLSLLSAVSTAGVRAGKGGRLLNTVVLKMVQNYEKLAPVLGLAITEEEREFDVLIRILDVITNLSKAELRSEAIEAIGDLFGGIRGAKVIAGLSSVRELLDENLDTTSESAKSAEELNEAYLKVIKSVSVSSDRIVELKKHVGELFIRAVAGGDNAQRASIDFANFLENRVIPLVQQTGMAFHELVKAVLPIQMWAGDLERANRRLDEFSNMLGALTTVQVKLRLEAEELSPEEIQKLKEDAKLITETLLKELLKIHAPGTEEYEELYGLINRMYRQILQLAIDDTKLAEGRLKLLERRAEGEEKIFLFRQKINNLEKDVSGMQQALKLAELESRGLEKTVILREKVLGNVKSLVEMYNKLKPKAGVELKPIEIEETQKTLEDFVRGVEGITAEKMVDFFPAIPNIREVTEFKEALKNIVELLKEEVKVSADLTNKEKEKINIQHLITLARQNQALSGADLVALEIELVKNSKDVYTEHAKRLKLYELEKEQIEELKKKIQEYANEIRSATREGFAELLKGGEIDSFVDTMKQKLIDMWADALSIRVTDPIEGIFAKIGGIFAEIEDPVLRGFNEGALITYNAIVNGFRDGSAGISTGVSAGGRLITGTPAGGTYPGGIPSMIGGGVTPSGMDIFGGGGRTPSAKAGGQSMFAQAGGWGGVASAGMGAYAGYQSGGTKGAVGGAMMGLGSMLLMSNPIIGGLLMLGSMFVGKKKKSVTTSDWQQQEAGEMFPYYGMNIPSMPKMYPLGKERYSGQAGKGTGEVTIQINIDSITGTDKDIADKIAKEVNGVVVERMLRDSERGLVNPKFIV